MQNMSINENVTESPPLGRVLAVVGTDTGTAKRVTFGDIGGHHCQIGNNF